MGLLRRKPNAAEKAATATREAAVTASEHVQDALGTASERASEFAGEARVQADRAAEKLADRAEKARERADAAGRRADRAQRKAGKKAAAAAKRARKAASSAVDGASASLPTADRKAERKIERYSAKADAGARKAEAKAQKASAKAQAKSEKAALEQHEKERLAHEWNAARAKRYISLGRVVAPVLAPYAMAAAGTLRHRWDDHRSRRLGVSPEELGGYSGRGGHLHARISRIARTFGELKADGSTERSPQTKAFVDTNEPRLHDFASAVRAAEQMPVNRRKAAYKAVSNDLDRIEVELLSHLGIKA
jgi:hypothetical protein